VYYNAVLNCIEISHKLFTPEMVVPALSIHDTASELWVYVAEWNYIHSSVVG